MLYLSLALVAVIIVALVASGVLSFGDATNSATQALVLTAGWLVALELAIADEHAAIAGGAVRMR